jgi:hypothetical protein
MTKTQVAAYIKSVFAAVDGQRMLIFFPQVRALIAKIEAQVATVEAAITAGLPETFTGVNVVDALFVWAETAFPADIIALRMLQFVVDSIMTKVPALN